MDDDDDEIYDDEDEIYADGHYGDCEGGFQRAVRR
jgi:hypothetical protein